MIFKRKKPAPEVVPAKGHKVLVPDAISDGKGGYHPVGAYIEVPEPESLIEKGLIG